MKIKIYLLTLLMSGALLLSCQKEDNNPVKDQKSSGINNNYLSFQDRNAFETAINSKDLKGLRTANFKSLKEAKNDLGIDNEFLQSVLSPEGEVQIGQWLFKLNGMDKTVKVLNPTNKAIIGNFSFNDDVLDILENGYTSSSNQRVELFCGESGVSQSYWDVVDNYTGWYAHSMYNYCEVSYQKYGVYFELNLKVAVSTTDPTQNNHLIQPVFEKPYLKVREFWYKGKCKNTQHGYVEYWPDEPYKESGAHMARASSFAKGTREKLYASTTALAKYRVIQNYYWADNYNQLEQDSNHGF